MSICNNRGLNSECKTCWMYFRNCARSSSLALATVSVTFYCTLCQIGMCLNNSAAFEATKLTTAWHPSKVTVVFEAHSVTASCGELLQRRWNYDAGRRSIMFANIREPVHHECFESHSFNYYSNHIWRSAFWEGGSLLLNKLKCRDFRAEFGFKLALMKV